MKFKVVVESRIGGRSSNQDRADWAHSDAALLLVVADGMGGHRHGEVASRIAVEKLIELFRARATPTLQDPERFLTEAIGAAHKAINDYAALRTIPRGDAPRTTCVACVVQDGEATWAHVGDSRLYHLRKGRLLKRTLDHSRVQMLLDAGAITPAEAENHPQRNLVLSCLGGDATPRIEVVRPMRLQQGDVLALCTDGVWAPLADRLLTGFSQPLPLAVPFLLDQAESIAGTGCDNLTLLALRWESEPKPGTGDTQAMWAMKTLVQDFSAQGGDIDLSDAEIDRAVTDIRDRITDQKPREN